MVKITVVGIIGCPRFERAKHIVERLKKIPGVEAEVRSLFETQFEDYMFKKTKEIGSYYFVHKESPIATLDDREYIGGAEELGKWAYVRYHDTDLLTMEDYEDLAQMTRVESYVLLPNFYVHFKFAIGCSRATFTVTVELFTDACPKACVNILHLCHGDRKDEAGRSMSYVHSEITRVSSGRFLIFGQKQTIYGEYTPDECYETKHLSPGIIGVTNEGRNQHTSQLYMTLAELPSFDRKQQIVGRVVEGLSEVRLVADLPSKNEKPRQHVFITQCGLMPTNPRTLPFPLKLALKEKLIKKTGTDIVIPEILETPRPNVLPQSYQLLRNKVSKAVRSKAKIPTLFDTLWKTLAPRRSVKIIATLGPASANVPDIIRMLDVGMNVTRIQFGTMSIEDTLGLVEKVKEANKQRPDKACCIMAELNGGRVRVGKFKKDGQIVVEEGASLTLTDDQSKTGNQLRVIVNILPKDLEPGTQVLIRNVVCQVKKYGKSGLHIKVVNGGTIAEFSQMHFEGYSGPTFTEEDAIAVSTIIGPKEIEFVLASPEQRSDLDHVKQCLASHNIRAKVISRLTKLASIEHCEEIAYFSDGIMFSRADHQQSIPLSRMFSMEHRILTICKAYRKLAIAGMPLLNSMESQMKPSRSDCLNAASFVLDGYDALVLGRSTATGLNHISTVQYLSRLCAEGEKFRKREFPTSVTQTNENWVAHQATDSAAQNKAAALIVISYTGNEAIYFAQRPLPCPMLLFTPEKLAISYTSLMRGITGLFIDLEEKEAGIKTAIAEARRRTLVSTGELVVVVFYGRKGEEEMKVVQVANPVVEAPANDE